MRWWGLGAGVGTAVAATGVAPALAMGGLRGLGWAGSRWVCCGGGAAGGAAWGRACGDRGVDCDGAGRRSGGAARCRCGCRAHGGDPEGRSRTASCGWVARCGRRAGRVCAPRTRGGGPGGVDRVDRRFFDAAGRQTESAEAGSVALVAPEAGSAVGAERRDLGIFPAAVSADLHGPSAGVTAGCKFAPLGTARRSGWRWPSTLQ
jgi:hypothetical protein